VATPKSRVRAGRIVEEESGVTIDIEKKRAEKPLPKIKTMEEFSAASGISRATVSKYFNDPDSVRPATRERIEKALNPIPEWRIVVKDKYPAYITRETYLKRKEASYAAVEFSARALRQTA
jgi:transcriptional regulator with XRE-family HTH domain